MPIFSGLFIFIFILNTDAAVADIKNGETNNSEKKGKKENLKRKRTRGQTIGKPRIEIISWHVLGLKYTLLRAEVLRERT